jgi:hypothetical protein
MSTGRVYEWHPATGVFGDSLSTAVEDRSGFMHVLLCPVRCLDGGRGTFALMVERASLGRFAGTLDEARIQAERVLAEHYPGGR